ncbi:MAG: type II toxin-antitoxin system mRNA interferase toxin, RelE/StbE family [Candidatus Pacebacteria bacterium]|nr:type II toxin-antitoxin system mRNA interferase toxin, RelE/StbE family [Candidatus Paceibacterota bacterium]
MEILYKPTFIRQLNKLNEDLQEEVLEKIGLFNNKDNHVLLKVHKLHGELKEFYSFSVNYKIRIVFIWSDNNKVILVSIGDHDVYK